MFRTNKMPILQEKSASGSVATFNTALAMPLVKCEVSFMATQSGSGTPSPVNKRPIVPVSSVAVTFNGTAISKALGADYGGGYIDLLTGKAYITHFFTTAIWGDLEIRAEDEYYQRRWLPNVPMAKSPYNNDQLCNVGVKLVSNDLTSNHFYVIERTANIVLEKGLPSDLVIQIWYPLATPIELTLTPTQLSTIVGNNTIFADTGDIDLTYKDLDIAKRGNFREVFRLPS